MHNFFVVIIAFLNKFCGLFNKVVAELLKGYTLYLVEIIRLTFLSSIRHFKWKYGMWCI